MKIENIKGAIFKEKSLIIAIVALLVIIGVLFFQKQNYKFILLYQYQVVPDIELTNTLTMTQNGLSGEVRGFVKFDNTADQPKNLRQYYILKPLNKFVGNSQQYFSLEEIIKMPYLAPRNLGVSELVEVSETSKIITLENEIGNKFFIDKLTKGVSMKDVTGDSTTLITSDNSYGDFIKGWLAK